MAVTHPTSIRTAIADLVVDSIDGASPGYLEFQTSGDVEVATITFQNPAFGAASNGVAAANTPMVDDSNATGGTMAKFKIFNSGATQVGFAGSVGVAASGEDIEMSSLVVGATDTVSLTSLSYTAPL